MQFNKVQRVLAAATLMTLGAFALGPVGTVSASSGAVGNRYVHACVDKAGKPRIVTRTTVCRPGERKSYWLQGVDLGSQPVGGGRDGSDGTNGKDGVDGKPGAQGPAGPVGARGPMGPRGPQGFPGKTGPAGPKGDKGEAGPQGPKGEDGAPGKDGKDGEVTTPDKQTFDFSFLKFPGLKTVTFCNTSKDPKHAVWSKCGGNVTSAAAPAPATTPTATPVPAS